MEAAATCEQIPSPGGSPVVTPLQHLLQWCPHSVRDGPWRFSLLLWEASGSGLKEQEKSKPALLLTNNEMWAAGTEPALPWTQVHVLNSLSSSAGQGTSPGALQLQLEKRLDTQRNFFIFSLNSACLCLWEVIPHCSYSRGWKIFVSCEDFPQTGRFFNPL